MTITSALALVVGAGAAHPPSYMRPAGGPGDIEARLGWALTITALVVVALVTLVLLAGILRHRGEPQQHEVATDGAEAGATRERDPLRRSPVSGVAWIYVGLAATVVVLIATFAGTVLTLSGASRLPAHPALTLQVIGHQWWWEVRYDDGRPEDTFVTANEIHIPVGTPVRLELSSPDVIHSFWIPELAGKTDLIPGQRNEAWLRADRPGVFRGQCAEYCGLQHAHMGSIVVADAPAEYARWAAAQRASAATPTDSAARVGAFVFARSCGACHAVRGTEALGRLGPDLTHVASRATIAAGLLPNTQGNLIAWVNNAQALKPGAQMPSLALDGRDLLAVVTYLRTLH